MRVSAVGSKAYHYNNSSRVVQGRKVNAAQPGNADVDINDPLQQRKSIGIHPIIKENDMSGNNSNGDHDNRSSEALILPDKSENKS